MTERGPIGRLADVFVFGPLGLVVEARSLWPEFAEQGRRTLHLARDTTVGALEGLGLGGNGAQAPPLRASGTDARSASGDAGTARSQPMRPEPAVDIPVVDVATLAIPDYDSLSASQVVPRLDGLEGGELEQVRLYELGNRGRKTILNKIAQLEAG